MEVFVRSVQKKTCKTGEYLDLVVRCFEGEQCVTMSAKIWPGALECVYVLGGVEQGRVYDIRFTEDEWQGKKQLNILECRTGTRSASDFKEAPAVDQVKTYDRLFRRQWGDVSINVLFGKIDVYLRQTSRSGMTLYQILLEIPAGVTYHHNRRAGLLQHFSEMFAIADWFDEMPEIADVGPWKFDYQTLIASILLHDIGKIWEYSPETMQWDATAIGERFGHTCWLPTLIGSLMGQQAFEGRIADVVHCVLSHHGLDGGAPVAPKMPEAILLHRIDQISAELDVCREAQKAADRGEKPAYSLMLKATPICKSYES